MARIASARRHAQAIFELALEKNELDLWRQDLKKIYEALQDDKVMSVLETPKLPFEAKKKLLQETLPDMSAMAMNLVYFLTVKGRLNIMPGILEEYEKMVDAHNGIGHAELILPFPVEEGERAMLGDRLATLLGKKKVVLDTKVDPAIVGGMVARIGDKLIDGSTRTKLDSLKRSLQSGVSVA